MAHGDAFLRHTVRYRDGPTHEQRGQVLGVNLIPVHRVLGLEKIPASCYISARYRDMGGVKN
jgi:hypothetical protein